MEEDFSTDFDPDADPLQRTEDESFLKQWAPDVLAKWQHDPETLGRMRTAHLLIGQLRQMQSNTYRAKALNAYYGNVAPDMQGKTEEELIAIFYSHQS